MKKIRDRNMAYDDYVINANRVWSARLYFKANGQWVAVSNDYVQSMTINDYVCDGSNLTMGCFAGSKATLQLKNVSASVSAALVENVRLKVELSLTTDAIGNVGAAVLQSPVWVIAENKRKKRQGNTYDCSLTVYDISYTMTRSYTQTADAMTASQVVTAVGQRYGLTVDSSVASMVAAMDGNTPHTFGVIDSDITDKQMLAYVAGYYGCYAEINESEQICFSWFKTSDEVIGPDRIYDGGVYVTEMTERTIVMLESGTSDNPIVAPDNAAGFSINFENPYMTAERAAAIYNDKIANGKISFRIGKVRYKGNPVNNPGTILTVKDIAGESATFYIMKRTMRYDGGLSETIECMGESEQTVNYKVVSPTERKINRKLSRMEDAIKNATDVITQTKGSIYELIPVDENDPSKGNSGWKLHSTDESKQNVILANSSGIGFSSNGGQSFNAAAIYIDDQGVGHINANYINTGKLSADLIDTSELVISSGNVEGLSDKLSTLTSNVNSANATANSAKTTANNANTTASAAQTTANSVNTVIGQWCYNHDTTFIDGGKIYTGSIAANSIDVSKLKAGTVNLNGLLINNHWDSSGTYTSLKGWEFLNSTAVIDSTRKLPKLTYKTPSVYTNMIPNSISEFDTSELTGWKVLGGTYTKNVDSSGSGWIQVVRTSSWVAIVYKLSLEKWHRYSVSAQVNTVYWSGGKGEIGYALSSSSTASSLNDIEYHYFPNIQNITNQNEEVVIDFSFDYNGETGDRYVGLIFESPQTNQATNIAWIAVSDVTNLNRGTGFYCSYSNWLKSPYKNQTIPKVSSANAYLTALGKDAGVFPQGMYQPKLLVKGKRYTLFVRLEFPEGSYQDSSPELWLSVGGKKIEFSQINIDPISPALIRAALLKFTFDYDGDTSVKNIGVEWSGFNNYSGTPNYALFHYFELFQDSVAKLGFFASQSCWLASGYQTNNLITDVADFKYLEVDRSAFEVYDNQLYFRGYIQSEYGDIGCSRLSQKEISIDTGVKVYQDINDTTLMKSLYSSNLRIGVPQNEISSPVDWEGNNAIEFARYVGTTITMSRYNDNVLERETIFAPDGIQFSTSSTKTSVFYDGIAIAQNGNKVTFLANGINYNGRFISWSTILP